MEIVTATLAAGVIGFAGCAAMENNPARIDPDKCAACAQKCPVKVSSGGDARIEAAAS